MMKAKVDQDLCIGCGLCLGIAPDVFQYNDYGKAECIAEGDDESIIDAVNSCPVSAIKQD